MAIGMKVLFLGHDKRRYRDVKSSLDKMGSLHHFGGFTGVDVEYSKSIQGAKYFLRSQFFHVISIDPTGLLHESGGTRCSIDEAVQFVQQLRIRHPTVLLSVYTSKVECMQNARHLDTLGVHHTKWTEECTPEEYAEELMDMFLEKFILNVLKSAQNSGFECIQDVAMNLISQSAYTINNDGHNNVVSWTTLAQELEKHMLTIFSSLSENDVFHRGLRQLWQLLNQEDNRQFHDWAEFMGTDIYHIESCYIGDCLEVLKKASTMTQIQPAIFLFMELLAWFVSRPMLFGFYQERQHYVICTDCSSRKQRLFEFWMDDATQLLSTDTSSVVTFLTGDTTKPPIFINGYSVSAEDNIIVT